MPIPSRAQIAATLAPIGGTNTITGTAMAPRTTLMLRSCVLAAIASASVFAACRSEGDAMGKTNIEWATDVWNPIRGCSRVSEGCRNCYAERMAIRQASPGIDSEEARDGQYKGKPSAYHGLVKSTPAGPRWTGEVRLVEELLVKPLRLRSPRRIFVNSMSDLFHEKVSNEAIAAIFGVMIFANQHVFQILTKRAARMCDWFAWLLHASPSIMPELRGETQRATCWKAMERFGVEWDGRWCGSQWPLPHVWLGVSVEDQATADERIPLLLETPAAVRWVSYEPALGPVTFSQAEQLDWIVVGGESGPGARPFYVSWARSVLRQCRAAGVPAFVKQLGANVIDRNDNFGFDGWDETTWPYRVEHRVEHDIHGYREEYQGADCRIRLIDRKGGDPAEWPADLRVREFPT